METFSLNHLTSNQNIYSLNNSINKKINIFHDNIESLEKNNANEGTNYNEKTVHKNKKPATQQVSNSFTTQENAEQASLINTNFQQPYIENCYFLPLATQSILEKNIPISTQTTTTAISNYKKIQSLADLY